MDRTSAVDSAAMAARVILESSGETYRAEDTALRMGKAFGLCDVQIMAFPTGFVLSATVDGQQQVRVFRVAERSLRLDRIDRVNDISRRAADGQLDSLQALAEMNAMLAEAGMSKLKSCLFYALAAGFFTVMFGGRFLEFGLSLVLGFLVQTAQFPLARLGIPNQLRSFILGLIAAMSALVFLRFTGGNQEAIITGVIMPLLPGLALTNAVRDTMRGDLISGLARGAEALISAVLLSAGVASALLIGGFLWTT